MAAKCEPAGDKVVREEGKPSKELLEGFNSLQPKGPLSITAGPEGSGSHEWFVVQSTVWFFSRKRSSPGLLMTFNS